METTVVFYPVTFKKEINPMEKKRIPITIYTEMGLGPGTLNFVCNKYVVEKPFLLNYTEDTTGYPLARELFKFEYVKRVSAEKNVISITKGGSAEWYEISGELREFIRNYLMQDKPVRK